MFEEVCMVPVDCSSWGFDGGEKRGRERETERERQIGGERERERENRRSEGECLWF